jgi:hypothetical protein
MNEAAKWGGLPTCKQRLKSSAYLAPPLNQPINTVADRKEGKPSASERARSTMNATIFVITGAIGRTTSKDPVIRRDDGTIEDSSGGHRHPY